MNEVLAVTGLDYANRHPEALRCIDDAVRDITAGARQLRHSYFGCKAYDRWECQRSDHEYGFAPRHGHIVLRIGLTSALQRELNVTGRDLTADEQLTALAQLGYGDTDTIEYAAVSHERDAAAATAHARVQLEAACHPAGADARQRLESAVRAACWHRTTAASWRTALDHARRQPTR